MIQVLYKDNVNWWFGRLANGKQGYFPANYVANESKLAFISYSFISMSLTDNTILFFLLAFKKRNFNIL